MAKSRISFVPGDEDREAIRVIRGSQGMMHDASAIRWALRKAAKAIKKREENTNAK